MSRNTGNKFATTRKEGNPLLTGILVGMIIGVAMSSGLAWYILKSPSPFVNTEPTEVAKHPKAAAPVAPAPAAPAAMPAAQSAPVAASGVGEEKPRFEFYKVLTDKQEATVGEPGKAAEKAQPGQGKPAGKETYFLQAGSFSNADDAEKLKAKLTLMDMNVSVLTVTIPDKGIWHRVRVGPFPSTDEMNKARSELKQNGVDATPMRGQ
ncbi:MAG TPA: SPOR domain-containing protein [Gallionella sp.]|nr:SPOR domain-containing protein [Gallionella sp.]